MSNYTCLSHKFSWRGAYLSTAKYLRTYEAEICLCQMTNKKYKETQGVPSRVHKAYCPIAHLLKVSNCLLQISSLKDKKFLTKQISHQSQLLPTELQFLNSKSVLESAQSASRMV
jgi:hypothetical protein